MQHLPQPAPRDLAQGRTRMALSEVREGPFRNARKRRASAMKPDPRPCWCTYTEYGDDLVKIPGEPCPQHDCTTNNSCPVIDHFGITVLTNSGTLYYLVDGWLTRMPHRGDEVPGFVGLDLRRDGEPVWVHRWEEPVEGQEWVLTLQVREDRIVTVRRTTPVKKVQWWHMPMTKILGEVSSN